MAPDGARWRQMAKTHLACAAGVVGPRTFRLAEWVEHGCLGKVGLRHAAACKAMHMSSTACCGMQSRSAPCTCMASAWRAQEVMPRKHGKRSRVPYTCAMLPHAVGAVAMLRQARPAHAAWCSMAQHGTAWRSMAHVHHDLPDVLSVAPCMPGACPGRAWRVLGACLAQFSIPLRTIPVFDQVTLIFERKSLFVSNMS